MSTLMERLEDMDRKYGTHLWCVETPKSDIHPHGYYRAYANRAEITPNGDLILWGNSCKGSSPMAEVVVAATPKGLWIDLIRTDECGDPLGVTADADIKGIDRNG